MIKITIRETLCGNCGGNHDEVWEATLERDDSVPDFNFRKTIIGREQVGDDYLVTTLIEAADESAIRREFGERPGWLGQLSDEDAMAITSAKTGYKWLDMASSPGGMGALIGLLAGLDSDGPSGLGALLAGDGSIAALGMLPISEDTPADDGFMARLLGRGRRG